APAALPELEREPDTEEPDRRDLAQKDQADEDDAEHARPWEQQEVDAAHRSDRAAGSDVGDAGVRGVGKMERDKGLGCGRGEATDQVPEQKPNPAARVLDVA